MTVLGVVARAGTVGTQEASETVDAQLAVENAEHVLLELLIGHLLDLLGGTHRRTSPRKRTSAATAALTFMLTARLKPCP